MNEMRNKNIYLSIIILFYAFFNIIICSINSIFNTINISINVLMFVMLFALFYIINFKFKRLNYKILLLISFLMGLQLIGVSYIKYGNLDMFIYYNYDHLLIINSYILLIPIVYIFLYFVKKLLIDEKIYIFKTKKNRFIIFFTMLCSIIAIIYYFTFGITGLSDNYKEQLYLINNFSKISDSIPIAQNIYVIFINCIIEHQIDILLIYYSQVIVYGLLLSYLLFKLYKNGINKFAFYFSLLLSLFNPLIYYNLFSISEHVTAALFLLLYICYIFKNGFKYNISFVLINIAFVTFVNYGLLLIVLALYDFVFIKNYRKTSVKLISFIIVFYIIFTNINSVYYIKRESLLDSPTISHQTARYIAYENLNEIDKLSLGDSYNLNQISKFYNGENLNEIIKYKSNNISIEQKHSAFLSYLKLFKRNPKTAIQGFLNHVSPFFVFGNSNVFFNYKNIPSTFLFVFSPSLYIWALIILIFSIKTSNKKENKHKIALLFIIINVLFSGYSADISISFILYITLPIYIAYCSTKGSHVAQKPNTHQ